LIIMTHNIQKPVLMYSMNLIVLGIIKSVIFNPKKKIISL
jgi:hypothetical protein